jgi:hypothetical protein
LLLAKGINALAHMALAHNGLVAGSNPARPATVPFARAIACRNHAPSAFVGTKCNRPATLFDDPVWQGAFGVAVEGPLGACCVKALQAVPSCIVRRATLPAAPCGAVDMSAETASNLRHPSSSRRRGGASLISTTNAL